MEVIDLEVNGEKRQIILDNDAEVELDLIENNDINLEDTLDLTDALENTMVVEVNND